MVVKKAQEQKCGEYISFIKETPVTDLPTHLDTEKISLALFVTSDTLGKGDEEYSKALTKNFFYGLTQNEPLPQFIVFINKGVFLSCEGSSILEYLIELEKRGVMIYTSSTCLNQYQIKNKLCVGAMANMYTIWQKLSKAEKVITI